MALIGLHVDEAGVEIWQKSASRVHAYYQLSLTTIFINQRVIIDLSDSMAEQIQNGGAAEVLLGQQGEVELTLPSAEALEQGSQLYLYVIGLAVLVIVIIAFLRRKAKPNKKEIGLVGDRGSGKTQLFIGLCGGKPFESVPSITNNTTTLEVGRKTYKICDFIGDNLSKEEVISELPRFHTIVHVVDGADSKKLSDAGLFIYRMLISKTYQKDPCNYILFLNKEDEKGFHGLEKLVKRIEDEIETIKSSRKNQVEDNEGEEDYLRNDRTRFSLKGQGIVTVTGSAKSNRKNLEQQLEELCG